MEIATMLELTVRFLFSTYSRSTFDIAFMIFCASTPEMQEIMEANDVYSYDELSNVEDADNDNYDLSAHVSDGGDYEQDESYDDFDLL